jgi:tRNA threonylcarbamoyladenosine biosynthesis protein TsaB
MCPSKAVNTTPKPLILAVETSSRIGSVAIALGEELLAETAFSGPMRHSAEIFPVIQNLMQRFARKPHEIEQVHISIGPGSFTGLRIATTLAKTMHLASGAKIVAVDTLDVIAANVIDFMPESPDQNSGHEPQGTSHERIVALLDAKRNQFFLAVYQRRTHASRNTNHESQTTHHGIWEKVVPDCLMTAAQLMQILTHSDEPIYLLGDGLLYHRDKFKAKDIRILDEKYWSPRASKVHLLGWRKAVAGQFADPLSLQPAYLRKPDVTIKTI